MFYQRYYHGKKCGRTRDIQKSRHSNRLQNTAVRSTMWRYYSVQPYPAFTCRTPTERCATFSAKPNYPLKMPRSAGEFRTYAYLSFFRSYVIWEVGPNRPLDQLTPNSHHSSISVQAHTYTHWTEDEIQDVRYADSWVTAFAIYIRLSAHITLFRFK